MIASFGYERGGAPARAKKVFDVRDLTHATGSSEFTAREEEITNYAKAHPGEDIAIGCKAGKHRSVVLAERISNRLRVSRCNL